MADNTRRPPAFNATAVPDSGQQPAINIDDLNNGPVGMWQDKGRLPLSPATVLSTMTERTSTSLKSLGWKEGDPVDAGLSARLSEMRQEVIDEQQKIFNEPAALAAALKLDPKFKVQKPQDLRIEDLPEQHQAELRALQERSKVAWAQHTQETNQQAQLDEETVVTDKPEIAAAHRALMKADMEAGLQLEVGVDDGTPGESTFVKPSPEQVAAAKAAMNPTPPPVPPPKEEAEIKTENLTAADIPRCPRCTWDLNLPFKLDPDDRDKYNYIATILGQQRFKKKYKIFGGRGEVALRALTATESGLIMEQLRYDALAGEITNGEEYISRMNFYRLIGSIESMVLNEQLVIQMPTIDEQQTAFKNDSGVDRTAVIELWIWFCGSSGIPNESTQRMLAMLNSQFQQTLELLEVMSQEPDFWKGIDAPL